MGCLRKKTGRATITRIRYTQDLTDDTGNIRASTETGRRSRKSNHSLNKPTRRKAFEATPVLFPSNGEIPKIPKSTEDERIIEDALKKNEFLNKVLSEEIIKKIVGAVSLRQIKSGENIIQQGDKGSAMYISSTGTYEVIVNGNKVFEFNDNRVFGELAILYRDKRSSTISAKTDGAIWCLNRETYQLIFTSTNLNEEEEKYNFLMSIKELNSKGPETLRLVANLLKNVFFEAGTKIVREGDRGDLFYIIRAGSVDISKKDEGSVTILGKGKCFGELALQGNDIRKATVTALAPGVECLTLNRYDFQNYFGDIEITDIDVKRAKSLNEVQPEYLNISLGQLSVLGTLGVGGFGRVELVEYKKQKNLVFALKRMAKSYIVLEGKQKHALNEKYIQMNCKPCPFIPRLYRTYRSKKYIYFLMEPCLGGDLFALLQRNSRFTNEDARFIVGCVIEAIAFLHARNIVYRDLKPENILIDKNGYFKLADLGFAKKLETNCSKTYTFVGTPDYTAPEVIKCKGHDKAVDYWALGILIYELLAGKAPFHSGDPTYSKTLERILKGMELVPFPDVISSDAKKLVLKFCKPNPMDRLGMSKDGINKIRKDKWFGDFEWEKLAKCKLSSPFKPKLKGPTDMSYFPDRNRRSMTNPPDELSGWDKDF